MNARKLFTALLLVFVAVTLAVLIVKEARNAGGGPAAAEAGAEAAGAGTPRVIAYYFYGNVRCATCRKIEAYAYEAIRTQFKDALAGGELAWRTANTDEPANAHFVDEYQLSTRSVVLVRTGGEGQAAFKNLERIWELVGDKAAYQDYIVKETRLFLEKKL
ncbi:MAG: hypothetical protein JXR37_02605 [Kiritimatiellae bacterium]|nr:hypothetical protein [Kiritimatiellia bacterium]